jgi:hypothetical protein
VGHTGNACLAIQRRVCTVRLHQNSRAVLLVLAGLVCACSDRTAGGAQGERPSTGDKPTQSTDARQASFINKVWRVQDASDIPSGALYVFLSDGTLVIASPTGTPALGQWRYENDTLMMVEEGIGYGVEVLELTADTFRIRSHNPGEPVDITFFLATEESGR